MEITLEEDSLERFLYKSSTRTLGEFLNSWQNHHLWVCRNRLMKVKCVYIFLAFSFVRLSLESWVWSYPKMKAGRALVSTLHTVPLISWQSWRVVKMCGRDTGKQLALLPEALATRMGTVALASSWVRWPITYLLFIICYEIFSGKDFSLTFQQGYH